MSDTLTTFCVKCGGTGMINDKDCEHCDGDGVLEWARVRRTKATTESTITTVESNHDCEAKGCHIE